MLLIQFSWLHFPSSLCRLKDPLLMTLHEKMEDYSERKKEGKFQVWNV